MKKTIIILAMLLGFYNSFAVGEIRRTLFNYQKLDSSNYSMSFLTFFHIGSGFDHPSTVGHNESVRNDTLFVNIYYNVGSRGAGWSWDGSSSTDTLQYRDSFRNFSYIHSATNTITRDSASDPMADTAKNVKDSTFELRGTGIIQTGSVSGFRIYPNPVSHALFIDVPSLQPDLSVTIADAYGKQVRRKTFGSIPQRELQIDLANMPAGIYIVQLFSGNNQMAAQRFVKLD